MTTARPPQHAAPDKAGAVVLSVAFPYAPLGPKAVGGAEVICSQLEAALPSLGLRSVVVAHSASEPVGTLYSTAVPTGVITEELRAEVEQNQQVAIDRALAENPIALVHMHGLDFHRYRLPEHLPVIVTLHLPPAWYPENIWTLPANYHLVCVSESQRRSCPPSARNRVSVINNGVPLPDAATLRPQGRYALMLARICPEKNLHTGFDAARLAGMPAILAGEVFPYEAHLRYLEEQIRPRLSTAGTTHETRHAAVTSPSARFLGAVAGHEKQRLLQRAACLLLPSLAPETSSLVAMEALAAGIPVIGLAVGAVPEIVDHGRTGLLVPPDGDVTAALSQALQLVPTLDRKLCRAEAERRFPLSRMIDAYGELYRRLAPLTPAEPPRQTRHERTLPSDLTASSNEPAAPVQLTPATLHTNEALHTLQPAWTELFLQDPGATPFQHPAWLLPWWHQFGPDGELQALALRDAASQQLLGFAPLYTYTEPSSSRRKLLLVGAGTTDYLDGLWSPTAPEAPALALHYALHELQAFGEASLHQLRSASPLVHAARAAAIPLGHAEACSSVPTSAELPSKLRINLGRYRRLAEAQGTLRCDLASTPAEALTVFDHLVRLHSLRWEERSEEGVLHDPRVLAHHHESLPLLLEAGLLRLFHLTLNDQTMGVLYALADAPHATDRRLYLYLIGFDARVAAFSPGSLLVHAAWQHAREHGFAKLDFLRGGESYKQLWGATAEPTVAIHLDRHPV